MEKKQYTSVVVSAASIGAVLWYALLEWFYFHIQGVHYRRIFAHTNQVNVNRFDYRSPWLALIPYIALLIAFSALAVAPAVIEAVHGRSIPSACARVAYVSCLWRSFALSAAVYATYDITTYITIFTFPFRSSLIDMAYGVLFLPAIITAPAAAFIAYVWSKWNTTSR